MRPSTPPGSGCISVSDETACAVPRTSAHPAERARPPARDPSAMTPTAPSNRRRVTFMGSRSRRWWRMSVRLPSADQLGPHHAPEKHVETSNVPSPRPHRRQISHKYRNCSGFTHARSPRANCGGRPERAQRRTLRRGRSFQVLSRVDRRARPVGSEQPHHSVIDRYQLRSLRCRAELCTL